MSLNLLLVLAPMAMATLTPGLERGQRVVPLEEAGRTTELCFIPKKLAGAKYSAKDLEQEEKLCAMNSSVTIAVCPKLNSTNPGVDFYSAPEGLSVSQVEAKVCEIPDPSNPKKNLADKEAKYKLSTSCSYTPSLLAYYHVSRALGDINQVPVAVLRTMDRKRHTAIAQKAVKLVNKEKDETLHQTWSRLLEILTLGQRSKDKDNIFTDDFSQSYGALQKNPSKEEKYTRLYTPAQSYDQRALAFRDRNEDYRKLRQNSAVAKIVSTEWNQKNVQDLIVMKEVADMVVMDYLLSQQDRFGNIHSTETYAYVEQTEKGPRISKSKKLTPEQVRDMNAVAVKEMMLKDNDCGVKKTNKAKEAGLLEGLRHLSPKTYKRLLKLNADLSLEETRVFFKRETMMTDNDFNKFRENAMDAVQILRDACKTGRLHLDLDLEGHFLNQQEPMNCDI